VSVYLFAMLLRLQLCQIWAVPDLAARPGMFCGVYTEYTSWRPGHCAGEQLEANDKKARAMAAEAHHWAYK
jgi:hypothetical protein